MKIDTEATVLGFLPSISPFWRILVDNDRIIGISFLSYYNLVQKV